VTLPVTTGASAKRAVIIGNEEAFRASTMATSQLLEATMKPLQVSCLADEAKSNQRKQRQKALLAAPVLGRFTMTGGRFLLVFFFLGSWKVGAVSSGRNAECIPTNSNHTDFRCFPHAYDDLDCTDNDAQSCERWSKAGECRKNPTYMLANCPKSCESCVGPHGTEGVVQIAPDNHRLVVQRLLETHEYVNSKVMSNIKYRTSCSNLHEMCTYWSVSGQCRSNSKYMVQNCPAACRACHL